MGVITENGFGRIAVVQPGPTAPRHDCPSDMISFAGLTMHPSAQMLFIANRAPIALGGDQARVLSLLIQGGGAFVAVARVQRETVNRLATTVSSLKILLRNAGGMVSVTQELGRGYRLIDLTAETSIAFGDLRLNSATGLLLIAGQEPIYLSPQNTAVLDLLMQARGGPVGSREVRRVSARTSAGAAVGNLARRLRGTGTAVTIVNDRSCGWRLVRSQ